MTDSMQNLLFIGCGSIGERHLRCSQKTGRCSVTACDPNTQLLAAMQERYGAPGFSSLDEALSRVKFDAAAVCTPAQFHLPMVLKLLRPGCTCWLRNRWPRMMRRCRR